LDELNIEIKILQKLNHPNIIKYHETFFEKNCQFIVMEFADTGDLLKIVKKRKITNNLFPE
jgi:serine/threonine protein kinase